MVNAEFALLQAAGHDIRRFDRSNDEANFSQMPSLAIIEALLLAAWNPVVVRRFSQSLRAFRPDVVHVHNTFPLMSPALLSVANKAEVPVVWTVHNFRPWCVATTLQRDGNDCFECVQAGGPLPGIRHGCTSPNKSLTVSSNVSIALHQKLTTWQRCVDVAVVLSHFQAGLLERWGFNADSIAVKPNFSSAAEPLAWSKRPNRIVFVGRLVAEKGVDLLLDALAISEVTDNIQVDIVGVGPMEASLRSQAAALDLAEQVKFHGHLDSAATASVVAQSKLLIMPSRWHEAFGLTVIEAYSLAVPVLVARRGALPELVDEGVTGAVFEANDSKSLSRVLSELWRSPKQLEAMSKAALKRFDERYSATANLPLLEGIYKKAIANRKGPHGF